MSSSSRKKINVTQTALEEFKKLVRKAIFLDKDEEKLFKSIPDIQWETIFAKNFNGNLNYAKRVMLYRYDEIELIDQPRVDAEKKKIRNLDKASSWISDAMRTGEPVVMVTDFDNDGSLSQAITREFLLASPERNGPFIVEYAQTLNGNSNRGITVDVVDRIIQHQGIDPSKPFLLVTADNGINSIEEQDKIMAKYPHARLIITDHHMPEEGMTIREDARTIIFNPKHHPTPFFSHVNISGASTIGVILLDILEKQGISSPERVKNIEELSKISNLLDYVDTDPVDKPQKDFVASRFLKLQPLLNINNSLNKIILDGMSDEIMDIICNKSDGADREVLVKEVSNIRVQNHIAKCLLSIYRKYSDGSLSPSKDLSSDDLDIFFSREITDPSNLVREDDLNRNFVEQMRPLIFGLSADDNKEAFLTALNEKMIMVFESLRVSEKRIADEIRKGEVVTKSRGPNSVISYADAKITSVFNRKYLNKIYNDENPGFSLMLDSVGKMRVSGSFRSLYDIADILKNKKALEAKLGIKIETPGHERAAGFIIHSANGQEITSSTIDAINSHIDKSIAKLKKAEAKNQKEHIVVDLSSIHLIDRINLAVRGNLANFERVVPLIRLTKDTVWTDSYSTEQFNMAEICAKRKYGYVSIKTDFHGGTVIVPVELVRRLVENDFQGYLSINYMDEGVFMAEKVVPEEQAQNIIDMRDADAKTALIRQVFSEEFSSGNREVSLTRAEIQDNPFFKYNVNGEADFDLFERMVIGIIDNHQVDELAVFDVEANGFGNSKIMNIGAMNYSIDNQNSISMPAAEFYRRHFSTERGDDYLLSGDQIDQLEEIDIDERIHLPMTERRQLLVKKHQDGSVTCYRHPWAADIGSKTPPFVVVRNFQEKDDKVIFNRRISAKMYAFLINDEDFRVPQEMTNLTGITQELLRDFGTPTGEVDSWLYDRYKNKKVIFGAHNTPYDSKVIRANMPLFNEVLVNSQIYDSALFARKEKLAYDNVTVSKFEKIPGIPATVYFYDNAFSEFTLSNFLESEGDGRFPDKSGRYLLERQNNEWYFIDKEKHDRIKLNIDKESLVLRKQSMALPDVNTKYSVEALSAQWMVRSLLLNDEQFNIKTVDPYLNHNYEMLYSSYGPALDYLQQHYDFSASIAKNIHDFRMFNESLDDAPDEVIETLEEFVTDFVTVNASISAKFADAWIYKKVLEIKDPKRGEVTNDLVELVSYQSDIPEHIVRKIFSEAIAFKEKYNIDSVLQHEGHVNGPYKTDEKGDVAFEDKLTLAMLAKRNVNAYSREITKAVKDFEIYASDARQKYTIATKLSDGLADDSYSFRQGLLYDRAVKTDLVMSIQEREESLSDHSEQRIIKFKLDDGILQINRFLLALKKEGAVVTREDIEADAKKFGFILLNEQIRNSLENGKIDPNAEEYVKMILEANDRLSLEHKKDLADRYCFVAMSSREHQFKNLLSTVIERVASGEKAQTPEEEEQERIQAMEDEAILIAGGKPKKKKGGRKKTLSAIKNDMSDLMDDDIVLAKELMYENARLNGLDLTVAQGWGEWLDRQVIERDSSIIEMVLSDPPVAFGDLNVIRDESFLPTLSINRLNPLRNLYGTDGYRMSNCIVEDNVADYGDDFAKRNVSDFNTAKPSKKHFSMK